MLDTAPKQNNSFIPVKLKMREVSDGYAYGFITAHIDMNGFVILNTPIITGNFKLNDKPLDTELVTWAPGVAET